MNGDETKKNRTETIDSVISEKFAKCDAEASFKTSCDDNNGSSPSKSLTNGDFSSSNGVTDDAKQNGKRKQVKMAMEPGFIDDFFKNSRLHLISSQKRDMQCLVGDIRENLKSHKFLGLERFKNDLSLLEADNRFNCNDSLDKARKLHSHVIYYCYKSIIPCKHAY